VKIVEKSIVVGLVTATSEYIFVFMYTLPNHNFSKEYFI